MRSPYPQCRHGKGAGCALEGWLKAGRALRAGRALKPGRALQAGRAGWLHGTRIPVAVGAVGRAAPGEAV